MLGPVLFLAYISDIDVSVQSVVSCFADDTSAMKSIASPDDALTCQGDLTQIYEWAEANNMRFNDDKFQVLNYNNGTRVGTRHYTSPDGATIESV